MWASRQSDLGGGEGSQVWLDMEGTGSGSKTGLNRLFVLASLAFATEITFHAWGILRDEEIEKLSILATIKPMLGESFRSMHLPAFNLLVTRDGADAYRDAIPGNASEGACEVPGVLQEFLEPRDNEADAIRALIRESWPRTKKMFVLQNAEAYDRKWLEEMPIGSLPTNTPYWKSIHKACSAISATSKAKSFDNSPLDGTRSLLLAHIKGYASDVVVHDMIWLHRISNDSTCS
jgi:hypothetical protein